MRIVCGLTTSATALNAARFAATLAGGRDADVLFVHVIASPWLSPGSARARRRQAESRRQVAACYESLVDELGPIGVAPRLRVVVGDPAQALREMAFAAAADLLVIGASRRGTRARALAGSVQSELTGHPRHPVLVVPAGHAPVHGGRVVLAQDPASRSLGGAAVAGSLALAIGGSVKVLYDPHAGAEPVTGWSAYDTLRCSTETVAATAGDAVDVSTHRVATSLLTTIGEEADRDDTAFVVIDEPPEDRRSGRRTRRREHVLQRMGRPWVVVPHRRADVPVAPVSPGAPSSPDPGWASRAPGTPRR